MRKKVIEKIDTIMSREKTILGLNGIDYSTEYITDRRGIIRGAGVKIIQENYQVRYEFCFNLAYIRTIEDIEFLVRHELRHIYQKEYMPKKYQKEAKGFMERTHKAKTRQEKQDIYNNSWFEKDANDYAEKGFSGDKTVINEKSISYYELFNRQRTKKRVR